MVQNEMPSHRHPCNLQFRVFSLYRRHIPATVTNLAEVCSEDEALEKLQTLFVGVA
jgi:hypothetical protein